jgi:hypothetical protein
VLPSTRRPAVGALRSQRARTPTCPAAAGAANRCAPRQFAFVTVPLMKRRARMVAMTVAIVSGSTIV